MASDRRVWVLIPAAGESRRFKDAGFNTPKPYLFVSDRYGTRAQMLNHVLHSLGSHPYVMTALPDGREFNSVRPVVRLVVGETRSHLHTVEQMLEYVSPNDGVVIMDCDTIISGVSKLVRLFSTSDISCSVLACPVEETTMSMARINRLYDQFYEPGEGELGNGIYGIVSVRYFDNARKLKKILRRSQNFSQILKEYGSVTTQWTTLMNRWEDWGTPEKITENKALVEEKTNGSLR